MSRIAVATLHRANYQSLAEITMRTKQAYCCLHGYDLVAGVQEDFDGWSKPPFVLELLQRGYEAVLWTDCDALITNPATKIEHLCMYGEFVVTADIFGINTGVFLARNTNLVIQLLYAVHMMGRELTRGHPWAEQEAFIRFASAPPYRELIKTVPQRVMNSYCNRIYNRPEWAESTWHPGDFILHMPGLSLEQRIQLANEAITASKEAP